MVQIHKFNHKKVRPTSLLIPGDVICFPTVSNNDSVLNLSSEVEVGSSSHHGETAPPSDAVWNEGDLDSVVHVHSDAVTNSSSLV